MAAPASKSSPASKTAAKVATPHPSPKIRRVAALLKQLSDPTRLKVMMLLKEKERNVSELCQELGAQTQPAVSHHLALLRHGRLIEPHRRGKNNYYGLTQAGRNLTAIADSVV